MATKSKLVGATSYTDAAATRRLLDQEKTKVYTEPTYTTDSANWARIQKRLPIEVETPSTVSSPAPKEVGVTQPIGYKFNLPPHSWSLPVRPVTLDSTYVGPNEYESFHGLRRGRLWFWAGAADITKIDTETGSAKSLGTSVNSNNTGQKYFEDNKYGFQFLWNPTSISTSVARNMEVTPSPADSLRVVAGVFPGQESLSLSIVLDRINDFACIKGATKNLSTVNSEFITVSQNTLADYEKFSKYYASVYPGQANTPTTAEKLMKLMEQGTMADLEYLFKAINGGYGWTNLLKKQTANIGFLSPTLLGIQIGPNLDGLNYVGWISNISINHTNFTENMIPIRTEVSIAIECFSGSGITAK